MLARNRTPCHVPGAGYCGTVRLAGWFVLAGVATADAQALNLSFPARALNANAGLDSGADRYPQLATDGAGQWVAVWFSADTLGGALGSDNDILVSRSSDNAATWSAPQALNTNAATDTGADSNPWLATDRQGHWVCVWYSADALGGTIGTDNDILVSRSSDNGVTWTAPAALNTNAATDSGSDINPVVEVDASGVWIAVWTSTDTLGGTIGADNDIIVSRSTNHGATWTAPQALNSNAGTDSGADYAPRLAAGPGGKWVAVWYSNDTLGGTVGSDNDIFISTSANSGATWTAVRALHVNATTDVGSDLNPCVATDGAGYWVAAWYSTETLGGTLGSDNDLLVASSSDNGATWSPPVALNSTAATDTASDTLPHVLADGQGRWIAVWSSTHPLGGTIGGDADILAALSLDHGLTWSAPQALTTTAATDWGTDSAPLAAVDGSGDWVVVWESTDDLQGTVGTDYDIFVTRFAVPDCNGNAIPDPDEADSDGDGVIDACDNCPSAANADQTDSDNDGAGNACDICPGRDDRQDSDADGKPDGCDNCPSIANASQSDSDSDGVGNACDGCPTDTGKTQAGICGCGVADTDTDADGVPDCLDACAGGNDHIDSDGDGTPDCADGCPNNAFKSQPGACGCNQPDTDSDRDLVPDCLDVCPGADDRQDTDGDGMPDCRDGCPQDRNKAQPGVCGCGVSDADADGDGVPNCLDLCPGANDRLDTDADGTPNCFDKCPNDPNKTAPGLCGCGVTELDTNHDGLIDHCGGSLIWPAELGDGCGPGASSGEEGAGCLTLINAGGDVEEVEGSLPDAHMPPGLCGTGAAMMTSASAILLGSCRARGSGRAAPNRRRQPASRDTTQ